MNDFVGGGLFFVILNLNNRSCQINQLKSRVVKMNEPISPFTAPFIIYQNNWPTRQHSTKVLRTISKTPIYVPAILCTLILKCQPFILNIANMYYKRFNSRLAYHKNPLISDLSYLPLIQTTQLEDFKAVVSWPASLPINKFKKTMPHSLHWSLEGFYILTNLFI